MSRGNHIHYRLLYITSGEYVIWQKTNCVPAPSLQCNARHYPQYYITLPEIGLYLLNNASYGFYFNGPGKIKAREKTITSNLRKLEGIKRYIFAVLDRAKFPYSETEFEIIRLEK